MRKRFTLLLPLLAMATGGAQTYPNDLVLVEGGIFKNPKSNYYGRTVGTNAYLGRTVAVASFLIGKFEVTQQEWQSLMGNNPSKFRGDHLPVENVSWYDCIEFCNRRSTAEGLQPCYVIDQSRRDPDNENEIDDVKWTVSLKPGANGYRLPTEVEWEYAASGGQKSRNYTYSGGNEVEVVAWYWTNSGDQPLTGMWSWPLIERNHNKTHPVGSKTPNELGLHDMSGNVREWCWNWYGESASNGNEPQKSAAGRVWRGGGWMGGDFCCELSFRAGFEASGKGPDQGFRVCRDVTVATTSAPVRR